MAAPSRGVSWRDMGPPGPSSHGDCKCYSAEAIAYTKTSFFNLPGVLVSGCQPRSASCSESAYPSQILPFRSLGERCQYLILRPAVSSFSESGHAGMLAIGVVPRSCGACTVA